ncbi:hypothetical protein GPA10_12440 [Streptomyces sp. p1417]|uniref:Peptidase inhibitor family I36 n=1 Tax=Streptomyces typhae TaxID=2681492 RepID=A0A6L6WVF0_9ACTN|nr:hypothetical protein [Streptomyces typhae]MVO85539.1 hypothetical protein [Streptomyces typhae]
MTRRTGLRKRLAVATGLTALVAAGTVAFGAAPASAGENCASGYHCVFYLGIDDSARHSYFNTDSDFRNDTFNQLTGRAGGGQTVHNNVVSVSNSSSGGYESHYYTGVGTDWEGFIFCVNPGRTVDYLKDAHQDRASSLRVRGTTSVDCY